MDTLPFAPIELIAVDPARNIRRRWRVAVARDLFGAVTVETGWGRIGGGGSRLMRSFETDGQALRYVRALLARRGTAHKRLGIGYVPAPWGEGSLDTARVALTRHACFGEGATTG